MKLFSKGENIGKICEQTLSRLGEMPLIQLLLL